MLFGANGHISNLGAEQNQGSRGVSATLNARDGVTGDIGEKEASLDVLGRIEKNKERMENQKEGECQVNNGALISKEQLFRERDVVSKVILKQKVSEYGEMCTGSALKKVNEVDISKGHKDVVLDVAGKERSKQVAQKVDDGCSCEVDGPMSKIKHAHVGPVGLREGRAGGNKDGEEMDHSKTRRNKQ